MQGGDLDLPPGGVGGASLQRAWLDPPRRGGAGRGLPHVGVCTTRMTHFFCGCVGSHTRARSTRSPASSSP